jgi:glycosyltransferase involved in cell wall biosynthesis
MISVCMIVKDEEAYLRTLLPLLIRQFDEVIVVDTGSTDHSPQIAKTTKGVRYFERLWDQDFAAARNAAIAHATGDYILVLDADETLPSDARHILEQFIAIHPNDLGVTRVISDQWTEVANQQQVVSHITRFFPNHPSIRYEGIIHEQVVDHTGKRRRLDTGLLIHHAGYALPVAAMNKKSLRNLALIDRALSLEPSSPQQTYYLYQRGKSLDQLQRHTEALQSYEEALKQSAPAYPFYPELMMAYLYDLKRRGDQATLWDVVGKALTQLPDYPDLYFFIGIALIQLQIPNLDMIQQAFETCLALGDKSDKYPTVIGTGSFLAAYNLGAFYESQQDTARARSYYELAALADYAPAKARLAALSH